MGQFDYLQDYQIRSSASSPEKENFGNSAAQNQEQHKSIWEEVYGRPASRPPAVHNQQFVPRPGMDQYGHPIEQPRYIPPYDPRYSPESQIYGRPIGRPEPQSLPPFAITESPYHPRVPEGPIQGRRNQFAPQSEHLSPEQLALSVDLCGGKISPQLYKECRSQFETGGPQSVRQLVQQINEDFDAMHAPYILQCLSQFDNFGRQSLSINLIDQREGTDIHNMPINHGSIYLRP